MLPPVGKKLCFSPDSRMIRETHAKEASDWPCTKRMETGTSNGSLRSINGFYFILLYGYYILYGSISGFCSGLGLAERH